MSFAWDNSYNPAGSDRFLVARRGEELSDRTRSIVVVENWLEEIRER